MSMLVWSGEWGEETPFMLAVDLSHWVFSRFAPLLQKRATSDDPSRVIVTASVAGLEVGMLSQNGTFGYSASKGTSFFPPAGFFRSLLFKVLYSK